MEDVVPREGKMIRISNGRLKDIGSVGFYVPKEPAIALFYLPLLVRLKEKLPVYVFGNEDVHVLGRFFKGFHIFPLQKTMGIRERWRKRRQLPHPHILITPEGISLLHLYVIRPSITIGQNDSTIYLKGNTAFQYLSKLLDVGDLSLPKNRKRKKAYYHPNIHIDGMKRVEKEDDLDNIGHLFSPPSYMAGIGYLKGIRITLFVKNVIPLLPPQVEQVLVEGDEGIKRYLENL